MFFGKSNNQKGKCQFRQRNEGGDFMNQNQLIKGTIIKAIFVSVELTALIAFLLSIFSKPDNDTPGVWGGHWTSVGLVCLMVSPVIVYILINTVFCIFHMNIVLRNRHTDESIRRYHKWSKIVFIVGIVSFALYGGALAVIPLLDNLSLFRGYLRELER